MGVDWTALRAVKAPMGTFSKLQWMDAVRRCIRIPPMHRLVILHIGDTADRYGNRAWRDNDRIVAELSINKDTVTEARKSATKSGLMVETTPARGGRNGGRSAEYRLTIPQELVRRGPDDSEQMVRNPQVNGPEFAGKWSGGGRTPSGISSGSSSADGPTAHIVIVDDVETHLTKAELDELPF